jgi:hypothetical protein
MPFGTRSAINTMSEPSRFREFAAECRQLALTLSAHQRAQVLEIAETWERLAEQQEKKVETRPK